MNTWKYLGPHRAPSKRGLTWALEKYAFSQRISIIRRYSYLLTAPRRDPNTYTVGFIEGSVSNRCSMLVLYVRQRDRAGSLGDAELISRDTPLSRSDTDTLTGMSHGQRNRTSSILVIPELHYRETCGKNPILGTVGYA